MIIVIIDPIITVSSIAVSLMHPGWRLNLERELALCSDVPVSLLQRAPEQVTTEAGYLMAIVRCSIQLDIGNSIEYSIEISIDVLQGVPQYCKTIEKSIEYSIEFPISN